MCFLCTNGLAVPQLPKQPDRSLDKTKARLAFLQAESFQLCLLWAPDFHEPVDRLHLRKGFKHSCWWMFQSFCHQLFNDASLSVHTEPAPTFRNYWIVWFKLFCSSVWSGKVWKWITSPIEEGNLNMCRLFLNIIILVCHLMIHVESWRQKAPPGLVLVNRQGSVMSPSVHVHVRVSVGVGALRHSSEEETSHRHRHIGGDVLGTSTTQTAHGVVFPKTPENGLFSAARKISETRLLMNQLVSSHCTSVKARKVNSLSNLITRRYQREIHTLRASGSLCDELNHHSPIWQRAQVSPVCVCVKIQHTLASCPSHGKVNSCVNV